MVDVAALSEEALNSNFMPRIAVPDYESWLGEDLRQSSQVRAELAQSGAQFDRRYGQGPRQLIDLIPARTDRAPILVWVHGGYWRALSKEHYTNIAPPLIAAGAAVALVGYDLCPTVTLSALLAQTRDALRWVRANAAELNGDRDRIILAGNSAGAHICAMALQHDWSGEEFDAGSLRAAALITGIYDLSPVPSLPVQAEVRLGAEDVQSLSPLKLPILHQAKCLVAVGAEEPPLWIDQSSRYHEKLRRADVESNFMLVPGRHHFSITRDLTDAQSPLAHAVADLLQS